MDSPTAKPPAPPVDEYANIKLRANGVNAYVFENHVHIWRFPQIRKTIRHDMMGFPEYASGDEFARETWAYAHKQKVSDTSGSAELTVTEKFERMDAVSRRLRRRVWNGDLTPLSVDGRLLIVVLLRHYAGKLDEERIRAVVETKSEAEVSAMLNRPDLKKIADSVRGEQIKAANVDGNKLLAEFDAMVAK